MRLMPRVGVAVLTAVGHDGRQMTKMVPFSKDKILRVDQSSYCSTIALLACIRYDTIITDREEGCASA
jgi:hypothetical protein